MRYGMPKRPAFRITRASGKNDGYSTVRPLLTKTCVLQPISASIFFLLFSYYASAVIVSSKGGQSEQQQSGSKDAEDTARNYRSANAEQAGDDAGLGVSQHWACVVANQLDSRQPPAQVIRDRL